MKDKKRDLKAYDIHFAGLKDGEHLFEYQVDNHFFEFFDYHEFNSVNHLVQVRLQKKSTLLELDFPLKALSMSIVISLMNLLISPLRLSLTWLSSLGKNIMMIMKSCLFSLRESTLSM